MEPTVSIILTVYQRTEYLRQALQAALSQTFLDFEIIVTDDSNSPAIRTICAEFSVDPRVRYRSNLPRLGVVGNLQAALSDAKGKYVSILNDDDYWAVDFLEKLVSALQSNPGAVLAFCDHWIVDFTGVVDRAASAANSARYGRDRLQPGPQTGRTMMEKVFSTPLAMGSVFEKSALVLEEISTEVKGAYDFWMAYLLARTGRDFSFVPERLSFYRVHSSMETGRSEASTGQATVFIFEEILRRGVSMDDRPIVEGHLAKALFISGLMTLRHGSAGEARSIFWRTIKLHHSVRAWTGLGLTFLPQRLARRLASLSTGAHH